MTAKQRREREVERMAKHLMRLSGHRGDHGWKWDTAPSVVQKVYVDEARYVLRLLAAERRACAKDAARECDRWKQASDIDGDITALGACSNIVGAILRGGRP